MDLGLKGKTALVSASTAGIGFSIAEQLAVEGVTVYINGRSEERVQSAIDTITEKHPKAMLKPLVANLATKEGFEIAVKKVPAVDILVNNLGIYEVKSFEEISDSDWSRFFEINVLSGIRLSRHFLPAMKSKNWGRVIFISSESGLQIPVEMIHYGVSKTCQIALARGLAESLAGSGVTVNSVLPGPTRSEGVETFIEQLAHEKNMTVQAVENDFFKNVRPSSLLKRFETTDEIAAIVTFVCSEAASAITGSAIRAEGGVLRTIA